MCAECPAGHTPAPATQPTGCRPCGVGTYPSPLAFDRCDPCPLGTQVGTIPGTCDLCPAGTYAAQTGSLMCSECTPASLCPLAGTAEPATSDAAATAALPTPSVPQVDDVEQLGDAALLAFAVEATRVVQAGLLDAVLGVCIVAGVVGIVLSLVSERRRRSQQPPICMDADGADGCVRGWCLCGDFFSLVHIIPVLPGLVMRRQTLAGTYVSVVMLVVMGLTFYGLVYGYIESNTLVLTSNSPGFGIVGVGVDLSVRAAFQGGVPPSVCVADADASTCTAAVHARSEDTGLAVGSAWGAPSCTYDAATRTCTVTTECESCQLLEAATALDVGVKGAYARAVAYRVSSLTHAPGAGVVRAGVRADPAVAGGPRPLVVCW
jgi:hypothetical protein